MFDKLTIEDQIHAADQYNEAREFNQNRISDLDRAWMLNETESLLAIPECDRCLAPVEDAGLCSACRGSKSAFYAERIVESVLDSIIAEEENSAKW